MFQSLCWPANGWGQSPSSPRVGAGLLVDGLSLQATGCGCLTGVHLLVVETGPNSRTGSLVCGTMDSGAGSCPLVSGAGSGCRALGALILVPTHWCVEPGLGTSGGQDHVQGRLWG